MKTSHTKLGLLASAKRIMEEEGVTLRRAAERLQVSHSLLVKWQQQRAADDDPILDAQEQEEGKLCWTTRTVEANQEYPASVHL